MADYATTKIVKTLRFPGNTDEQYQINAVRLDGHTYSDINERISALENFDALRYEGTITAGESAPGGLTPAANKGDVYKVVLPSGANEASKNYYVMGVKVESGDMLICNTDSTASATSSNYASIAQNWDIIQTNIDEEAILDHYHTGELVFSRTDKTLSHTITPGKVTVTGTYKNGTATVTGNHGHTASGSVTCNPTGTVSTENVTVDGTVTLTTPTTKGDKDATITPKGTTDAASTKYVTSVTINDHEAHKHDGTTNDASASVSGTVTIKTGTGTANYTPAGTVGNSSVAVTDVEAGDTTVSKHSVTEQTAGGHTPSGTVTVDNATATGTVASHKHNVTLDVDKLTHTSVESVTATWTKGSTDYDGTLTVNAPTNSATYVSAVAVDSVESVAPAFTGIAHNHGASFSGNAVAGHTHSVAVADHDTFVPVISVTKGNHNHAFTGTGAQLVATHALTAANHKHAFETNDADISAHSYSAPVETAGHTHTFTGNNIYVHAAFAGTANHNHTFTGNTETHNVSVTVNDYTGSFSGSSAGTIELKNAENLINSVTINDHKISTVDSGSVTTDKGIK